MRKIKNYYKNLNFYLQYNKLIIVILYLLIIPIISINLSKMKIYNFKWLNKASEIIITISGRGSQQYINQNIYNTYRPSEILVNGNPQSQSIYANNLQNNENNITVKWNQVFTTCSLMFKDLNNIIKIYLSNFDSSQVTTMKSMFNGCTSLTSIIFNNFDTSKVTIFLLFSSNVMYYIIRFK